MGRWLSKQGVSKIWSKAKEIFAKKTDIPTKTSDLTNDSGYLTTHQDISGKANLAGNNTFTGGQTITGNNAGYSVNASGYVKGSWLQAPSTGKAGSNTGKVCVLDSSGWIYYRTPAEIVSDGGGTNSEYLTNVAITSSSSGSTLVKGTTGSNADDPGSGPRYPATGTINIGLGATDITITPLAAIDANGSYNPSTGDYSWTLYAATEKAKVTGTIKWSGGDDQLKITKNGSENVVGYFNKINGQSIVALDSPKDFSFYNKTEVDTKLNSKSNTNHTHESILDYGDTNKTIKIGYSGAGLTSDQILYIAGYTAGADSNEHKIKDISKDVLKSWLGSEVVTGSLSSGSSLTIANSTYAWIVYPQVYSTNTFSFSIGSSNYTGYHFAIIQSGTPGCIRYFSSTTTLKSASTTSITFSTAVNYVRFKIA